MVTSELKNKFTKFMKQYGEKYDTHTLNCIKNHFGEDLDTLSTSSPLMQIYSELGVYGENDFYTQHIERIKNNFDIGCNVLEVGSGNYPTFGNKFAYEQLKLQKGTITLYDPLLVVNKPKYQNMTLIKEEYSKKTNITNYDLIVGIMPCEATRLIIESACLAKKSFYVALCSCVRDNEVLANMPILRMMGPRAYQDYLIKRTKELLDRYDNGELQIEHLDPKYGISSPVLYNRKR